MARIRTIKPELFRSRKVSECPVRTRLTFIGLWTACDDEGRYRYEPELLRADLWPYESDVDVAADIHELAKRDLVCLYEVAGHRYVHVVNWHEHQKINHPTPSRLPECSRSPHGGLPEDSSPRARAQEVEVEVEVEVERENTIVEQTRQDDAVLRIFEAWQNATGHQRADLSPTRKQAITDALRRYPLEDVLDAAQGSPFDPWPDRVNQNDITQLLHMGSKRKPKNILEQMRDLYRNGPPPTLSKTTATALRTYQRMRQEGAARNGTHDLRRVDRVGRPPQHALPSPAD